MLNFYALIPAAGYGSRMGDELPKQYLPLAGRPMIFPGFRAFNTPLGIAALQRIGHGNSEQPTYIIVGQLIHQFVELFAT